MGGRGGKRERERGGGGREGDSKDRRERMESGTHTLLSLLSYLNDVSIT